MKPADFFDAQKYPVMKFVSTSVTGAGKDRFKLVADLTMHGVTKQVTLDVVSAGAEVNDGRGAIRAGANATTTINRKHFGLS